MSEKYNSETNAYQLNDNESVHANIYSYSDGTDIKIISFNTKQFIYSIVLNYYSRRPLISIYCIDNHYQPKNIFYSQFENYKSDKELKEICDLGTINFICSQLNGNTILESKIKEVGKLEECLGLINQASCYFE